MLFCRSCKFIEEPQNSPVSITDMKNSQLSPASTIDLEEPQRSHVSICGMKEPLETPAIKADKKSRFIASKEERNREGGERLSPCRKRWSLSRWVCRKMMTCWA